MPSPAVIYFSPTGTTRRILKTISEGMGAADPHMIDITRPKDRGAIILPDACDSLLIGMPVYEEHIPDVVLDTLNTCKGENRRTVVVAVYGGVGFGMALYELYHIATQMGCPVIGAAAFVAEHSFSCAAFPLAMNRPDTQDLHKAHCFGSELKNRMHGSNPSTLLPDDLPRFLPLMARVLPKGSASRFTHPPDMDASLCTGCGLCTKNCPTGAIESSTLAIDDKACLRCFACVRRCSRQARTIKATQPWIMKRYFAHHNKTRREPAIFWPESGNV